MSDPNYETMKLLYAEDDFVMELFAHIKALQRERDELLLKQKELGEVLLAERTLYRDLVARCNQVWKEVTDPVSMRESTRHE